MPVQETTTISQHRGDRDKVGNVIGERLDCKKFCKATGLRWSALLKYEEIGYLRPVAVKKGIRYYSWEQMAFVKRMQSFIDGKTCLNEAYNKALEHFAQ